jgi:AcrR family transcriptional regulator
MEHTTKERLLDTAERLFAAQGFDAVSIRQIVADAGVNLASVHYHFKSKEALFDAVVMRKATPVNDERLAMLDRAEAEAAGKPLPVEKTLEAFLIPTFSKVEREPHIAKLMGRIHAEGIMARLMRTHFQPVVIRFQAALQRALPALPPDELLIRLQFLLGAMVSALNVAARDGLTVQHREPYIGRLIVFLAAGLRAPAYKPAKGKSL